MASIDLAREGVKVFGSSEPRKKALGVGLFAGFGRVDIDTTLAFFSQFSFLLRSGLPLFNSLELVIDQSTDPRMIHILGQLRRDLINGCSLSEGMRMHPKVFTPLHISMVVVGEGSGKLDQAIDRIVKVVGNQRALRKKLQRLVNNLMIMLSVALTVMVGVLVFVFPKFAEIFSKIGATLPWTTRVMISASDFILSHTVSLPLGGTLFIMAFIVFYKSDWGRSLIDQSKLIIPSVRNIVVNAALSDFSSTMSSLLSTGVPMIHALEITRDTTSNAVFRPILSELIRDVREGEKVSESLARKNIFPNMMIQLTAVGENSGQLDTIMGHIHLYFKERVEESIVRMTTLLEPAIMILLGAIVLMMALSIFLPMFSMVGSAGRG